MEEEVECHEYISSPKVELQPGVGVDFRERLKGEEEPEVPEMVHWTSRSTSGTSSSWNRRTITRMKLIPKARLNLKAKPDL